MESRSPALFVGRGVELASFAEHMAQLRLALVYGVGGVGKTSFALRAAEGLADRHGARVVLHACQPGDSIGGIAQSTLAKLDTPIAGATPLAALIAHRTPVVLILDDLHRVAEPALFEAVAHIALRRGGNLWLCATSREALPIEPSVVDHLVVRLRGLPPQEARTLWDALVELYGAPGFVIPGGNDLLPLSLKQAFSGSGQATDPLRLAALNPLDASLVAELCAHRRPVPHARLCTDRDPEEVTKALARLRRRFLIEPSEHGTFQVHDLVRDAVLASPLAPGHAEHGRCSRWARTQPPGVDRDLDLVYHALRAGDDPSAIAILEDHASILRRVFPLSARTEHELLDAIAQLSTRHELSLPVRLLRERIHARQNGAAHVRESLSRIAAEHPDNPLVDSERGQVAAMAGDLREAVTLLGRAADSSTLDPITRTLSVALLADAYRSLGDPAGMLDVFDRYRDLLAFAGPLGTGTRLWMEAVLAHDSEQYGRAAELVAETQRKLAGLPNGLPLLASFARTVAAALGTAEGAAEPLEEFDDTLYMRLVARLLRVETLYFRGELREAVELARETWRRSRAVGYGSLSRWGVWLYAECARVTGDARAARSALALEERGAEQAGDGRALLRIRAADARILLDQGDTSAGRERASEALPLAASAPGTADRLHAIMDVADLLDGKTPPVRTGRSDVEGFDAAEATLARAEIALFQGRPEDARRIAAPLIANTASAGWRWLTCRAQLVTAEVAYRIGELATGSEIAAVCGAEAERAGWLRERAWAHLIEAGVLRARGEREASMAMLDRLSRLDVGGEALSAMHRLGLAETITLQLREARASYSLSVRHGKEWDRERYGLFVDLAHRRVKVGSRSHDLSNSEVLMKLLRALSHTPGVTVPHDALMREAWGVPYHALRHHSRVGMAIMRLRRLLGTRAIVASSDGYALVVPGEWAVLEAVSS